MYFCLGDNDVILIADMPDHVSAAALGSAACASGMTRTKTTVLLRIEEADEALSKPVATEWPPHRRGRPGPREGSGRRSAERGVGEQHQKP